MNYRFEEGPAEIVQDIHLHQRYFAYEDASGLITGKNFSVMFTVDRPAKDVWPYLKDFNLWQNSYGHFYSGVVGELAGKTFTIAGKAREPDAPGPYQYRVLQAIPEHLIVARSTVDEHNLGTINPGFHVLMLNEFSGKTVVTVLMMHQTRSSTEKEGLEHHRKVAAESHRKWRDIFIPTLKQLIREAGR